MTDSVLLYSLSTPLRKIDQMYRRRVNPPIDINYFIIEIMVLYISYIILVWRLNYIIISVASDRLSTPRKQLVEPRDKRDWRFDLITNGAGIK